MTLLFASSSVRQRLEQIMGLTWTHGKNLALFVGGYKLLLEVGRVAKGDKAIQVRVGTAEGARIDQMLWGITMHTPHRRSRYDSDRTLLLDAYIGSSMWTVPYYNRCFTNVAEHILSGSDHWVAFSRGNPNADAGWIPQGDCVTRFNRRAPIKRELLPLYRVRSSPCVDQGYHRLSACVPQSERICLK
jgi:hypothetical protein